MRKNPFERLGQKRVVINSILVIGSILCNLCEYRGLGFRTSLHLMSVRFFLPTSTRGWVGSLRCRHSVRWAGFACGK